MTEKEKLLSFVRALTTSEIQLLIESYPEIAAKLQADAPLVPQNNPVSTP